MADNIYVTGQVLAKLTLMELARAGVPGLSGLDPLMDLPLPLRTITRNTQIDHETGNAVQVTTRFDVARGRVARRVLFEVIRDGVVHRTQAQIPEPLMEDLWSVQKRLAPVVKRLVKSLSRDMEAA